MSLKIPFIMPKLAILFKHNGLKQESAFYWLETKRVGNNRRVYVLVGDGFRRLSGKYAKFFSAYTAGELLEVLKEYEKKHPIKIKILDLKTAFVCRYMMKDSAIMQEGQTIFSY